MSVQDIEQEEEKELIPDHLLIPTFFAAETCDCGEIFVSIELFEQQQIFRAVCAKDGEGERHGTTYMYRFQNNGTARPFIGLYRFSAAFDCSRSQIFKEFDGSLEDLPDPAINEAYRRGYADGTYDGQMR